MWLYDSVFLVAGLFLLLLIWYLRGKRHDALFTQLAPLLDAHPGEMQVAGPIRGGEDHVQGRYAGRDLVFAFKEPDRGHEVSRFRVVLGSAATMPFLISVQKRMLFGIVSQIQRGRVVESGDEKMDRTYRVTELTALTGTGLIQKLGGTSKISCKAVRLLKPYCPRAIAARISPLQQACVVRVSPCHRFDLRRGSNVFINFDLL